MSDLFFSSEVLYIPLGAFIGLTLSVLFWYYRTHILTPRVTFDKTVRKFRGPIGIRYTIGYKNTGRRRIIDIRTVVRFTVLNIDCRNIRQNVNIITNADFVPTLGADTRKIIVLHEENDQIEVGSKVISLVGSQIRLAKSFEELLELYSDCYIRIYVFGYDAVSGSRKMFRSDKITQKDIREDETFIRSINDIKRKCVWLIFPADDMEEAATRYNNRRLIEASYEFGLYPKLIDPRRVRVVHDGHLQWLLQGKQVDPPDVAVVRSGAKLGAEGRYLLEILDRLKVPILPSLRGYLAAHDKGASAAVLSAAGINTPKTMVVSSESSLSDIEDYVGFPCVIKRSLGSKGGEVTICDSPEHYPQVIEHLAGEGSILAQEYVKESSGRDLRVLVVGEEVVGCIERSACAGEFRSNVATGASSKWLDAPKDAADLAIKAARELDVGIAGVDLLFGKAGFTVCEVNTAPGFEAMEASSGKDIAKKIMKFVATKIR